MYCDRADFSKDHRDRHTYDMIFGSSYVKIITTDGSQKSVTGFIVKKDTKKFKRGDILKAASWNSPATNFSRGRIDDIESIRKCVRWTGVL
jgi:hypothetical protein